MTLSSDRLDLEKGKFVENVDGNVAIRTVSTNSSSQTSPVLISTSVEASTASWVDWGSEIDTRGYHDMSVYAPVTISSSTNLQFRALAKTVSAGTNEYVMPLTTTLSSAVTVEESYYELNNDADQNIMLPFKLNGTIPYIQLQVKSGAATGTLATVSTAYYVLN